MSGRKQHYIPQCLLRGFKAQSVGKKPQVVVYKRDQRPYTSSIEGVAAQRHFYSELSADGRKTLDDYITAYENRLCSLLNELCAGDSDLTIDPSLAAEVVTHLTVRAAFLRDSFNLGLRELISSTSTILSDSKAMRRYLGIDSDEPTAVLNEEIDRALSQITPMMMPLGGRVMLKRAVRFYLRESFTNNYGEHVGMVATILSSMSDSWRLSLEDRRESDPRGDSHRK